MSVLDNISLPLRNIRVFVPPFLEIRWHDRVVRGILWTERKTFQFVWNLDIVGQSTITWLSLRLLCPFNDFIDVSAPHRLVVADYVWFENSRHWSIVRLTRDILPKCVETVVDMVGIESLGFPQFDIPPSPTHYFLSLWLVFIDERALWHSPGNAIDGKLWESTSLCSCPTEIGSLKLSSHALPPTHLSTRWSMDWYLSHPKAHHFGCDYRPTTLYEYGKRFVYRMEAQLLIISVSMFFAMLHAH